MGKIIGKYEFEDVTNTYEKSSDYGWRYLLPSIEYKHKFWYMWEFEFMFWKWSKRIEITRTDWKDHPEKDERLFWKRLKKLYKKENDLARREVSSESSSKIGE
jgi:hypothetical protein